MNYSKAAFWLTKAADQGLMQAQNALGLMYKEGKGLPQDYTKAAELLQSAAAQGDDIAAASLGQLRTQVKLGNSAHQETGDGFSPPSVALSPVGFGPYWPRNCGHWCYPILGGAPTI